MRSAVIAFLVLATLIDPVGAFTDDEHRHIALEVFGKQRDAHTDASWLPPLDVTITPASLAEICVRSSRDDLTRARHHVRGMTPYEQAAAISQQRMEEIVSSVIEHPPTTNVFEPYADNVVANYLVYHTLAIRCAMKTRDWRDTDPPPREAPDRSEWAERALVYEAVAIGYLADAYSSSHMLTPIHLALGGLQHANVRAAHEFFATQGAYVCCRGFVWQAFGDGLLRWYGPAYDRVMDACQESVAKVVQVLRPRESIDTSTRTPSDDAIGRIPLVVVATWRKNGTHHLQLREVGHHDPDLQVDERFLYSREAFPSVQPHPFLPSAAEIELRDDPNLASVEYHQTLDVPPAFAGLLLMTGGGVLMKEDGGGGVGSAAAGYGWEFVMPIVQRLRTSFELEYLYRLGDVERRVIAPRCAVGLGAPVMPLVEVMHFEVGFGWGLNSPFKDQGVKWGVGIGTKPLRFPFTYAGVSARVKYERFWMDQVLDGFQLQLVFR